MRCREAAHVTMKAILAGTAVAGIWILGSTFISASTHPRASLAGELFRQDPHSGVLETRGEPLRDGAVVRTVDEAGLIQLEDRALIRLDPNSAVVFEQGPSRVMVRVLSGRASIVGPSGRILHGGAGSRFTLPDAEEDPATAERMLLEESPAGPRRR